MWFFYDSQGSRVGLVQGNNTYYYMYNVQGDVVGLVDAETGSIVATYEYDAWGKCTAVTNATGYTVGADNPFRYRGYYYDSETGYYYLNSRYYSPEFGRFINADSLIDNRGLNTQNLYAYCGNNSVNNRDDSGQFWDIALDIVFTVGSLIAVAKNPKDLNAWAALGADLICMAVPYATGGGIAVRAAAKADNVLDAAKTVKKTKTVSNVSKGANRAEDISDIALCFIAGTKVLTENGNINIEDIKTGDKVYSENLETGEKELKEVTRTFVNETDELVHVHIDNDVISATPEHPFYVKNAGWIKAGNLRAGDILVLQNGGHLIVEKIEHEILENLVLVYNFEVADYHTYYVGDSSVLVHNECVNPGRAGKQARLKELANDDKLSSALRGEIKRDMNMIERGQRTTIRVPSGYNLSHRIGYSAKDGYSYAYSDLQIIATHKLHHSIFGR